jgi:hypothetical protein
MMVAGAVRKTDDDAFIGDKGLFISSCMTLDTLDDFSRLGRIAIFGTSHHHLWARTQIDFNTLHYHLFGVACFLDKRRWSRLHLHYGEEFSRA